MVENQDNNQDEWTAQRKQKIDGNFANNSSNAAPLKTSGPPVSGPPLSAPAGISGPPTSRPAGISGPPVSSPLSSVSLKSPPPPPGMNAQSSNLKATAAVGPAAIKAEAGGIFDQARANIAQAEQLRESEITKMVNSGMSRVDAEREYDSKPRNPSVSLNKPQDLNTPNVSLNQQAPGSAAAPNKTGAQVILDQYLAGIPEHIDFDDDLGAMKDIIFYYASAVPKEDVGSKASIEDFLAYNARINNRLPKITEFLHNALYATFVKEAKEFDDVASFVMKSLEDYFNFFRKRGGIDEAWNKVTKSLDKVLKKAEDKTPTSGSDDGLRDYYESVFIIAYLLNRDAIKKGGAYTAPAAAETPKNAKPEKSLEPSKEAQGSLGNLDDVANLILKITETRDEKYFTPLINSSKRVETGLKKSLEDLQNYLKEKLGYFEQKLGSRKFAYIDLIKADKKRLDDMIKNESQYRIYQKHVGGNFFNDARTEYVWLVKHLVKNTDGSFEPNQELDFNVALPGIEKPKVSDLVNCMNTYLTDKTLFSGVDKDTHEELLSKYVEFKAVLLDLGLVDEWYTKIQEGLKKK